MTIPRVIHQTWRSSDVPLEWRPLMEGWRRHHPGWTHRLWTDVDNQRLVDEHYPDLAAQYASCSYGIQRADIARYLILHRHGGVYVDLDMECLRPLDSLVRNRSCVLTAEPALHASWVGRHRLVSNAFIAVAPGHRLMQHVIELLRVRDLKISRHVEVLTSTGPVLLEDALSRCTADDLTPLPSETFSLLTSNEVDLERLRRGEDGAAIRSRCLAAGGWAVHHWANTWARGLAGQLVNADPRLVRGYVFHPGVDSPGCDVRNAGRDITRLAAECDADGLAAGFNTDGFIKAWIRPRQDWVTVPLAAPDEGLYVKRAFHIGGPPPAN